MHKKCQPLRGWHGYMFLIISPVYLTGAHHRLHTAFLFTLYYRINL